jgi:hypothetical protein
MMLLMFERSTTSTPSSFRSDVLRPAANWGRDMLKDMVDDEDIEERIRVRRILKYS